jgi:hypothetical protein
MVWRQPAEKMDEESYVSPPKCSIMRTPTALEIQAARAYGADSGHFHLALAADHTMVLTTFQDHQEFLVSGKLGALKKATAECFALEDTTSLFSGHGNGAGVFGSFAHNNINNFRGMIWSYRGFTSTSYTRGQAEAFLTKRAKYASDTPVMLEFCLPAGYHVFPMSCLGADMTNEGEFLLSSGLEYEIVDAQIITVAERNDVRHLILKPISRV